MHWVRQRSSDEPSVEAGLVMHFWKHWGSASGSWSVDVFHSAGGRQSGIGVDKNWERKERKEVVKVESGNEMALSRGCRVFNATSTRDVNPRVDVGPV
jgi:hypothetical protein